MHRKRIEDLLEKVKSWVEQDSSSLTQGDQDRICRLLDELAREIGRTYDHRERTGSGS